MGDCLEIMKGMDDKSIDMILTDPPYGILKDAWDVVPSRAYFDEIFRISKHQIIFGANFFDSLPKKSGWIVWNKMPFLKTTAQCEFIYTSFNKFHKIIDFRYAGNCVGSKRPDYNREKVYFTSQKPTEFLDILLNEYVPKGSKVMDPFMGTGSTGVSCKALGYEFIGCEKEPKHFEIAKRRIETGSEPGKK